MTIISVSRRTDIPAFYATWYQHRLQAGSVAYRHPYTRQQIIVPLTPADVTGFVYWSKNYSPFLPIVSAFFERYRCYFHYTITGYGPPLEPGVPDLATSISTFRNLVKLTGSGHVILRYDPIILSHSTPAAYHRERFSHLLEELEGFGELCIISFVQIYEKVRQALSRHAEGIFTDHIHELDMATWMSEKARQHGFTVQACCMPDLHKAGIPRASCISVELFRRLYPDFTGTGVSGKTRKGCGCDRSHDIGVYDSCPHGCLYCYANARISKALDFHQRHDPESASLSMG